jgi:hypothetical protein
MAGKVPKMNLFAWFCPVSARLGKSDKFADRFEKGRCGELWASPCASRNRKQNAEGSSHPPSGNNSPSECQESGRLRRKNRRVKNRKVLKADTHSNLIVDDAIKYGGYDANKEDFQGFNHEEKVTIKLPV